MESAPDDDGIESAVMLTNAITALFKGSKDEAERLLNGLLEARVLCVRRSDGSSSRVESVKINPDSTLTVIFTEWGEEKGKRIPFLNLPDFLFI